MTKTQLIKEIEKALSMAQREVAAHASRGGIYAQGMAGEGYNGGYRDALNDVLLAANGIRPNNKGDKFWENFNYGRN